MRYVVVYTRLEDEDVDGDGGVEARADVPGIALCDDTRAVCRAITRDLPQGCDWAVFEGTRRPRTTSRSFSRESGP